MVSCGTAGDFAERRRSQSFFKPTAIPTANRSTVTLATWIFCSLVMPFRL
jgi:hypothetical protein